MCMANPKKRSNGHVQRRTRVCNEATCVQRGHVCTTRPRTTRDTCVQRGHVCTTMRTQLCGRMNAGVRQGVIKRAERQEKVFFFEVSSRQRRLRERTLRQRWNQASRSQGQKARVATSTSPQRGPIAVRFTAPSTRDVTAPYAAVHHDAGRRVP
jgi:hypothetical protein